MTESTQPSGARTLLGEFAPKLVELTDEVLFGDVWERPGLSPRDRSLVTVTTLAALCRTEQLDFHLRTALKNGLSKDELVEALTHLAFYAGWPSAMSAVTRLKSIVEETGPAA
ncbi:carboxymuconolactone decarboxylase family protein [Actinoallomurus rhizosphaericola]|uniref:carboxymuconolactone decarboxylase family protein n=1 Tax=Actinoallomurus rhizosphaericola TaxID=2952536 RepID=UPI002093A09E|nr:carboxymuconolactone decarboxylase family protein [Actinoallomurus rhizosphaericola]MCO5996893.1 carboxymuconolactone decarboxylase family protein [Actinoallomurus rhizosphaericola]